MKKRPIGVWLVSGHMFLIFSYVIFGFVSLILTDSLADSISSLGILSVSGMFFSGAIALTTAVELFMLKRLSTLFFLAWAALLILISIAQEGLTYIALIDGLGGPLGWAIAISITIYLRWLSKNKLLT